MIIKVKILVDTILLIAILILFLKRIVSDVCMIFTRGFPNVLG